MNLQLLSALLLILTANIANSQIRINEVCASNAESFYDEDFETPDWIELYNFSNDAVNLSNWKIADKNNIEKAWQLPDTTIQPKEYILVLASKKNRYSSTQTKFSMSVKSRGSIVNFDNREAYRYRYTKVSGDFDAELSLNIMRNEGVWSQCGLVARSELGDSTTFYSILASSKIKDDFFCYKREQTLVNPSWIELYGGLDLPYSKMHISRKGDTLTCAVIDRNGDLTRVVKSPNYLPDSVYLGVAVAGFNGNEFAEFIVDSLIINNKLIDIGKLKVFEVNTEEAGYDHYYRELHTDFTIKDEETIYLFKEEQLIDSLKLQPTTGDVSCIYTNDNMSITDNPTPAKQNSRGYIARLPKPEIHFIDGVLSIIDSTGATIRYTTDCSFPTDSSKVYNPSNQEKLEETTTVKAVAFKKDYLPSFTSTNIYFVNEPTSTLPIVALSADSNDLWGEYGIIRTLSGLINANFNILRDYNTQLFDQNVEIKIHGQSTKKLPQKSFRVYANQKCESNRIANAFFENSDLDEYQQITLRNSGQDWGATFFKDAYSAIIASKLNNQIYAQYQPAIAYLNSKFYGILNIRERIDDDFLADLFGIEDKSVNFFKNNGIVDEGSLTPYKQYYNKVLSTNYSLSDTYSSIDSLVDIKNFIDYILLYVYSSNTDWPSLNVKLFNSDEMDGKMRYIVNDLDVTYGYGHAKAEYNKLVELIDDSVSHLPIIFNQFIKNEDFKREFLTRTCDLVNSVFRTENMVHILDSLAEQIRPYIPLQQQRWDSSCVDWEGKLEDMREFLQKRPTYFMKNMDYNLNNDIGTSEFTLSTYPPNSGTFKVNTISIDTSDWSGRYFQSLPITITAVPHFNKKFVRWNYDSLATTATITTTLPEVYHLEAIYEDKKFEPKDTSIVINEIMYKPDKNADTKDWVELYNAGVKEINLRGWSFVDEDTSHAKYVFEDDYLMQPDEYVILAKDAEDFQELINIDNKVFGNFDFGLGGSDILILRDAEGNLQDSVSYDNNAPWPTDADGTGNSIELINPNLDNNIGKNWLSSKGLLGTAGKKNSVYDSIPTSVSIDYEAEDIKVSQFESQLMIKSDKLIRQVELFNLQGKSLSQNTINDFSTEVNLSAYNRGVYICLITTTNGVKTVKILLN